MLRQSTIKPSEVFAADTRWLMFLSLDDESANEGEDECYHEHTSTHSTSSLQTCHRIIKLIKMEEVSVFNKFFSDCRYMPQLRRYSPTKLCYGAKIAIFCVLYFQ